MTSGPARVLEALRRADGRTCSGEALSDEHGVSRTQVWKYVETLRQRGYDVEAEAGGGYRLAGVPDRLYPEELHDGLRTRWLARDVHYLDETDSTNRVAQELAREGAAHGTAVVAEAQTAGRGRLGRSFFSPAYQNVYTSIVLRPRLLTAEAPTWTLAAAVAVADAIADSVDDPGSVEIKWPNDVLLGGLKTCGILMELGAEGAHVAHLVLGIGVNLNVEREAFPDEFRAVATSVAAHRGGPVDRTAFARSLYGTLETVLDLHAKGGFDAVRPRFEAHFHMVGRPVRVRDVGGPELAGTAEGIDADGALLVLGSDGETHRVLAGDVTLREASP